MQNGINSQSQRDLFGYSRETDSPHPPRIEHPRLRQLPSHGRTISDASGNRQGNNSRDYNSYDVFHNLTLIRAINQDMHVKEFIEPFAISRRSLLRLSTSISLIWTLVILCLCIWPIRGITWTWGRLSISNEWTCGKKSI